MANPEHIEWLLEGVEAWNRRREQEDFRPDFEGADIPSKFREKKESSQNENDSPWSWDIDAMLTDVNLRNAILKNAILKDANLNNADLTNAKLTNADLTDAKLINADLNNAYCTDPQILDTPYPNVFLRIVHPEGGSFMSQQLVQGATEVFVRPADTSAEQQRIAELERLVGELPLELSAVKKVSTWLASRSSRNGR